MISHPNNLSQPLLRPSAVSIGQVASIELTSSVALSYSSIVLGLFVGIFLQLSTLGANWLMIIIFGHNAIVSATKGQVIGYSVCWSIITSAVSMWILKYLRSLVHVFIDTEQQQQEQLENSLSRSDSNERRMRTDFLLLTLESRFVGSAFIGVCVAWTITDLLLGLHVQMMYSLITLIVVLFWGFLISHALNIHESEVLTKIDATSHDASVPTHDTEEGRKAMFQVLIV